MDFFLTTALLVLLVEEATLLARSSTEFDEDEDESVCAFLLFSWRGTSTRSSGLVRSSDAPCCFSLLLLRLPAVSPERKIRFTAYDI